HQPRKKTIPGADIQDAFVVQSAQLVHDRREMQSMTKRVVGNVGRILRELSEVGHGFSGDRNNQSAAGLGRRAGRIYSPDATSRFRSGFSTTSASRAAATSSTAAIMKTVLQLPVPAGSRFASGMASEATPLAV